MAAARLQTPMTHAMCGHGRESERGSICFPTLPRHRRTRPVDTSTSTGRFNHVSDARHSSGQQARTVSAVAANTPRKTSPPFHTLSTRSRARSKPSQPATEKAERSRLTMTAPKRTQERIAHFQRCGSREMQGRGGVSVGVRLSAKRNQARTHASRQELHDARCCSSSTVHAGNGWQDSPSEAKRENTVALLRMDRQCSLRDHNGGVTTEPALVFRQSDPVAFSDHERHATHGTANAYHE